MRLLTGENGPGFCKLSKSRIDSGQKMRRGWSWARWRAWCLLACGAGSGRAGFGRGVRCLYDLGGNSAGKRAQVLTFSPCLPLLSSSLDVLAFSCWLCLFDLGGQAGGIGAAGSGVSVWPGCWACCALLRHGAGRAALVPCLNAQRFNNKCSIMTKIMPCILYFLRCKYACFGVK